MRRGHVRGFVAPNSCSAKAHLQTDKSRPGRSELCGQGTRVLTPCLPCHASDQQEDRQSDKTVSHLQPYLKCRDGVELIRSQPLRIDLRQKCRIHWRPRFSVREGKIRHCETGMLMAHGGSKNQLDENQAGTVDCQPIKASRNASRSK